MINYAQPGEAHLFTAPGGGVVSGLAYLIGSLVVIATVTADAAAMFTGKVVGVVEHAKVSAQAWAEGVPIYWDNSAKNFTTTVGANTLVGVAAEAAANPTALGKVRLDGVVR